MEPWLLPGERVEDLQRGGLQILQKEKGFHYGMDAVLLADFTRAGSRDRVLDLGTGTGILPLLLWGRGKGKTFDAIEIQPDMADMARRSIQMNHLQDRMTVHTGDVRDIRSIVPVGSRDVVVCNPPYGRQGCAIPNPDQDRKLARHQSADGLTPFLTAARWALRVGGKFSMIYPAQWMLEAMEEMRALSLTPKRFRLVYPFPDRAANLVLIEGIVDARPLLHTEPPLIIYASEGRMTPEVAQMYSFHPQAEASCGI